MPSEKTSTLWMLPFYLDEEAFDKEVMSWPGVKCNPCKSGMHYLLPMELLKKKGQEVGVGPSSGPEEQKKEAPVQTDSEEEEETQPLACKKRTLPMFPQLPEKAMLTGKDVNEILSAAFIRDPLAKKPRMGLSPVNILNPQSISSTIPRTRAMTRVTQIIDIQDDPEPDTTPSTTIITEQPPSPPQPQSPPREITIPSQTTDPEPMQLDPP
jgi:hypothetical protein